MIRDIPYLTTERLLLRPMHAGDLDELMCIFTDPKVMAAFDSVPFDRGQMTRWLQRNLDHQAAFGYGLFSVILRSNGLLIGDCGLEQMDVDHTQIAELGYDYRSDFWHQGYATEAALAVRDFAFNTLGLPEVISLIRVSNDASQRVAEKIGMARRAQVERYGICYWEYAIARPANHGA